jgi:hypothetical protein
MNYQRTSRSEFRKKAQNDQRTCYFAVTHRLQRPRDGRFNFIDILDAQAPGVLVI